MISKSHQGAIMTLLERKSRLYLALPIAQKTKDNTTTIIHQLLQPIKQFVHIITFDNGREVAEHTTIAT